MTESVSKHTVGAAVLFSVAGIALTVLVSSRSVFPEGTTVFFLLAAVAGSVFALAMLLGNALLQRALPADAGHKAARTVLWVMAGVYIAALVYLLFLMPAAREGMTADAYYEYGKLNVMPLATVRRYVNAIRRGIIPVTSALNLAGNVVLFFPMGMLFALLNRPFCRFFCAMPLLLLLIAATEMLQLFFLIGSCDIDDLILNFFGAVTGFLIAKSKLMRKLWTKQRFLREV